MNLLPSKWQRAPMYLHCRNLSIMTPDQGRIKVILMHNLAQPSFPFCYFYLFGCSCSFSTLNCRLFFMRPFLYVFLSGAIGVGFYGNEEANNGIMYLSGAVNDAMDTISRMKSEVSTQVVLFLT